MVEYSNRPVECAKVLQALFRTAFSQVRFCGMWASKGPCQACSTANQSLSGRFANDILCNLPQYDAGVVLRQPCSTCESVVA